MIDRDVGLTEMEKSGAATVTVAVPLALSALVAVAVTVIVYVPLFVAVTDQEAVAGRSLLITVGSVVSGVALNAGDDEMVADTPLAGWPPELVTVATTVKVF